MVLFLSWNCGKNVFTLKMIGRDTSNGKMIKTHGICLPFLSDISILIIWYVLCAQFEERKGKYNKELKWMNEWMNEELTWIYTMNASHYLPWSLSVCVCWRHDGIVFQLQLSTHFLFLFLLLFLWLIKM